MVTRLLHGCGLYLGPKDALMPPQADNPDGFWEHLGLVALNDELLEALGGAWDLPPKTNENLSEERLDPLRLKAQLLIEGFHSIPIWGWKDPRNSLTLPFWEIPPARSENADHRAQSPGSRILDAKAQWNVVCVWFAALGNL